MSNPNPDPDRLSDLPEPLLLHILSYLPTRSAIRTSLISRRFRLLWTASPSLHIDRVDFPPGHAFSSATSRCLRIRDPSAPLITFRLHSWRPLAIKTATRWLTRAYSLGLRDLHLCIDAVDFLSLLPLIVTFHNLRCLDVSCGDYDWAGFYCQKLESVLPPNLLATGLRILHLKVRISGSDLKRLVMEQTDLEDLCLELTDKIPVDLVSKTVKNMKLTFRFSSRSLSLVFPALVKLDLTIGLYSDVKEFHAEMPLLRQADIKIPYLSENYVSVVGNLLRCLVNVSQLSIHIQEASPREPDRVPGLSARRRKQLGNRPFHPLVEPGKDLSTFPHLRSLKLSMPFHKEGISDLICFLQNAPVLESVELHHVDNDRYAAVEEDWKSKLPQDSEGNNKDAQFSDLHLGDKKIELIRLLVLCSERNRYKKPRLTSIS